MSEDQQYVPQYLRTLKGTNCHGEEFERIPKQPFGTVGKVWHYEEKVLVDAIILSDGGGHCGGGDDIKVCARRYPDINDWDCYWIDANEFHPPEGNFPTYKEALQELVDAYSSSKRWANPWYKERLDELVEEAKKLVGRSSLQDLLEKESLTPPEIKILLIRELGGSDNFYKWQYTPNAALDGIKPIDLVMEQKWDVLERIARAIATNQFS